MTTPIKCCNNRYSGMCNRLIQGPQGPIGSTGSTGPTGPTGPSVSFDYGCFTSSNTQFVANVNEPTIISYDKTQIASGISYNGNNEIVFSKTGIYKVGCSPEFDMTTNQLKPVVFWFKKNYQDITDSASLQVVQSKDAETYTYVEMLIDINAGDNVQCVFASSESTMSILAVSANTYSYTHPAIPSVILTCQQIS
jgi:hypothetical protein